MQEAPTIKDYEDRLKNQLAPFSSKYQTDLEVPIELKKYTAIYRPSKMKKQKKKKTVIFSRAEERFTLTIDL